MAGFTHRSLHPEVDNYCKCDGKVDFTRPFPLLGKVTFDDHVNALERYDKIINSQDSIQEMLFKKILYEIIIYLCAITAAFFFFYEITFHEDICYDPVFYFEEKMYLIVHNCNK